MKPGMYYVNDGNSNYAGMVLAYNQAWSDHLGRTIVPDFRAISEKPELSIRGQKHDAAAIEDVLQRTQCEGFFHFADISQLTNFFNAGYIASRELAQYKGYQISHDSGRFNNHIGRGLRVQDYARFPIQSDNPILFCYEGVNDAGDYVAQPCILRVDPRMATVEGVIFSKTNANSRSGGYSLDAFNLSLIPIHDLQHKRGLDTKTRGAEIMYPWAAPINFVVDISFRSIGEMKHAVNLTQGWKWQRNFVEDPFRFVNDGIRTFLYDVCLGYEIPELGRKPDCCSYSLNSPIGLAFSLMGVKPGQKVKVKAVHESGQLIAGETAAMPLNRWDLSRSSSLRGNHKLEVILVTPNKEHVIYTANYLVG